VKSSGKSYDSVLPLSRLFMSKPELLKGNAELTNTYAGEGGERDEE
jgi:hypothetical protein